MKYTVEDIKARIPELKGVNVPKLTLDQIAKLRYSAVVGDDWARDTFLTNALLRNLVEDKSQKFLKVARKVRVKDLEPGCVLRYCGHASHGPHGQVEQGKEYKVTSADQFGFYVEGSTSSWDRDGWSFVSNPNYVHGFRIGETVYSTGGKCGKWGSSSGYGPYTVVGAGPGSFSRHVIVNNGGCYPPEYLTRDETKGKGYKPPVATYKVRDGEVQEGGDMWWLGFDGPKPAKMTPGGMDYINCKGHPQVYQLAEPEFDMVRIPGKYELVKAYRYMQYPYNGDSKAYYAGTEHQAIPEPKDWQRGDILRVISNAGDTRAVVGTEGPLLGTNGSGSVITYSIAGSCQFADRYEWVRRP